MNPADNIVIRTASQDDRPFIQNIWLENIQNAFISTVNAPGFEGATRYWSHKLYKQSLLYPIWVAEAEGEILGFQMLAPLYGGHPVLEGLFAEASLYVGKGHQAKGIGLSLLKQAMDHCDHSSLKYILAGTAAENVPSHKVLQRLGWQPLGIIPESQKAPRLPALQFFVYTASTLEAEPNHPSSQPVLIAV